MLIKIPNPRDPKPSEITSKSDYLNRRSFLKAAAVGVGAAAFPAFARAATDKKLGPLVESPYSTDEELNTFRQITTYNNFYEFGTAKEDPMQHADSLKTRPWTIQVDGLCAKPGTLDIETLLSKYQLEERIYRLRCVEAWSMVIPWVGIELASVLKTFEPLGSARYVRFETLVDPEQMPGQKYPFIPWPYVEGLRMDEATHPLSILGVGIFGEEMPNQNGAPVRLVVPWKYGFKSIKSIVRITFSDTEPKNTWQIQAPREYGFYANVNPEVDHPRWSQATERRIGEFFRRDTLPFNGYGDQVAHLYEGMDPRKLF